MIARKLMCLVLAVTFLLVAVPVTMAGDTPPPGTDDHSIHPWDNNDGHASGGPVEVVTRPWSFFWFGSTGQLFWVTFNRSAPTETPQTRVITRSVRSEKNSAEFKAFGRR